MEEDALPIATEEQKLQPADMKAFTATTWFLPSKLQSSLALMEMGELRIDQKRPR